MAKEAQLNEVRHRIEAQAPDSMALGLTEAHPIASC